jgi:ribonuclease E
MSKTMLINTTEGHECRIAIMSNGRLEELYTERASAASQVGNIYKGKVTNIEPSIQAAFIDFGGSKNGFLHISDVHPQHFPNSGKNAIEPVGRRTAHKTRPPIQECLKRGQDVIVQMTKEGIGTKGPTMTTYLSIPGRLMVFMPGMKHVGISRKIEDEDDRSKLREILDQLNVPKDIGLIVRTAGVGRAKRDLQRDLSYLNRLWGSVKKRGKESKAPAEVYQESDLVIRTIRDVYDSDIKRIICDSEDVAVKVREFLDVAVPRAKGRIELYLGHKGIFEDFGVETELQRIHSRTVELSGGGSLVFDQAEALVAIDVNSGSFRQHSNAEQNALKLNLLAADEICRQLRLRDMGGVIVCDFVDMRHEKNRRQVEKAMRDGLKKDRAKSKVLRLSSFGLMELTRQRLRPSLKQSVYSRCPRCDGSGLVMSDESMALEVMRKIHAACSDADVAVVKVTVAPSVSQHLSNVHRQVLADLEQASERKIHIFANQDFTEHDIEIECSNARGSEINWEMPPPAKGGKNARDEMPETIELRKWLADQEKQGKGRSKDEKGSSKDSSGDKKDDSDKDKKSDSDKKDDGDDSKKKRRRGRRGGRGRGSKSSSSTKNDSSDKKDDDKKDDDKKSGDDKDKDSDKSGSSKRRTSRRSRSRKKSSSKKDDGKTKDNKKDESGSNKSDDKSDSKDDSGDDSKTQKKRRRGRRGGRRHKKSSDGDDSKGSDDSKGDDNKKGSDAKEDDKKSSPKEVPVRNGGQKKNDKD